MIVLIINGSAMGLLVKVAIVRQSGEGKCIPLQLLVPLPAACCCCSGMHASVAYQPPPAARQPLSFHAIALLQAEEYQRMLLKAAKRAEADRRAGIDRQLASMSAAERRAAQRRERERREAEKRRWGQHASYSTCRWCWQQVPPKSL